MKHQEDIFDLIMRWRIMRPFYPLYHKHKEGLLYLFFGGLTFFLGIGVYVILTKCLTIHELIANIISWVIGVLFSFFTTRKWVFADSEWKIKFVVRQMGEFYAARLATLLLQEVLLYIFIVLMGWNGIAVKICTEIINIILNYIVSKFIIFSRKE